MSTSAHARQDYVKSTGAGAEVETEVYSRPYNGHTVSKLLRPLRHMQDKTTLNRPVHESVMRAPVKYWVEKKGRRVEEGRKNQLHKQINRSKSIFAAFFSLSFYNVLRGFVWSFWQIRQENADLASFSCQSEQHKSRNDTNTRNLKQKVRNPKSFVIKTRGVPLLIESLCFFGLKASH